MTIIGTIKQLDKAPPDESAMFFLPDGRVQVLGSSVLPAGVHPFERVAEAHGWLPAKLEPERPTLGSRLAAIARRLGL